METLTVKLTELTGAVNALHDEIRRTEARLSALERQRGTLETEMLTAGTRIGRLERVNQVQPTEEVRFVPQAPTSEQDLREIGKLPDCVKEIQIFEGNPSQYISWVHNVESILKDYEIIKMKPLYRSILQHIRQKVRGRADAALVSYNIFNEDWGEIKRVLSLHYADKRDVRTLEHQLNQLSQRGSRLDEFYATVNHQLSLIINKIKSDDYSEETVNALVETYRNRALDVFVRGLNTELSRTLIIQKPKTLPEAYSACLDMQNLTMRNNIIHVSTPNKVVVPLNNMGNMVQRPPLPPRQRFNNNWGNRPETKPHFNSNRPFGHQGANSPFAVKNDLPTIPEKMEVDESVRTKHVNYMNRPPQKNNFKRKAYSLGNQAKHQRMYHTQMKQHGYADIEGHDEDTQQPNFMDQSLPAFLV